MNTAVKLVDPVIQLLFPLRPPRRVNPSEQRQPRARGGKQFGLALTLTEKESERERDLTLMIMLGGWINPHREQAVRVSPNPNRERERERERSDLDDYARRMDQPTQRATNYTARSNIDTAQICLHANGQRPNRAMIRQRSRGRGAGSHTPSTASEFQH